MLHVCLLSPLRRLIYLPQQPALPFTMMMTVSCILTTRLVELLRALRCAVGLQGDAAPRDQTLIRPSRRSCRGFVPDLLGETWAVAGTYAEHARTP